jgi:transcriptional regulator GlxA family with amidase domain
VHAQIVLFDGFDPLDVIAPFDVLVAGSDAVGGELVVELVSAEGPGPAVSGSRGLVLNATAQLDPSKPGYVIVPGASGPPRRYHRTGRAATGSCRPCGGSLALAMAGQLEGRNAVTHVLGLDVLDTTGVNVVRARVVDDGDLVTAGGVTSGLDLALHLLHRSYGPRVALAVEELFEYERRGTVWT